MKELHIWLGKNCDDSNTKETLCVTLEDTENALKSNKSKINTTQTHVCSTLWLTRGYRIFVHMLDDEVVEIKLGYIKGYSKEIRVEHNLEKLLLSGCFGKSTIS
ncbi:hypothetical protein D3C81_07650 [compost metagenome]